MSLNTKTSEQSFGFLFAADAILIVSVFPKMAMNWSEPAEILVAFYAAALLECLNCVSFMELSTVYLPQVLHLAK